MPVVFTGWGRFVAMRFGRLGRAHSLRAICGGLACFEGKLRHLGVPPAPKRSKPTYANEHRPRQFLEAVFRQLRERARQVVYARGGPKQFRFKNKLMGLDASVIDLSVSLFDWARFRRTKGGRQARPAAGPRRLPAQLRGVPEGKAHAIRVARTLRFEPGTIPAIDRGYTDYPCFVELTCRVTRLKDKAAKVIEAECEAPKNRNALKDQLIWLPSVTRAGEEPVLFRRLELWDEDSKSCCCLSATCRASGPPPSRPSIKSAGRWSCSSRPSSRT